jgi:RHS repeat-associated protein
VTKPLLGIAATLAATIGAPWLAAAQTPRDALVQTPAFAKPERGSLTGALANLSFGAADLSRGAHSLSLPVTLPSQRGGVLASVIPTYSPDAGISEWGAGWSVGLAIQRYRVLGDVDYATDDFTSPWGRLVAGTDGYYYASGLSSAIRLKRLGHTWEAVGPDGTRYQFAQRVDTTEGTYAWYLTSATSIFGDATTVVYEANASGRPFVKHVFYGGRADPTAYRADFVYATLATPLRDFRSGAEQILDRRVSAVVANVKHRDLGSYAERWRYQIGHAESPFGPGFYLDTVTRTFASGESEPAVSYDYDLGELRTQRGLELRTTPLEPAPVLDEYLDAVGDVDGLQSNRASVLDMEEDGISEREYVYDYSLAAYSPDQGWTFTALPPATSEVDTRCRPGESLYNGPRSLVRLHGTGGPVSVLALEAFWSATEMVVCDRAGARQFTTVLEGSWSLGANTKVVDLNRDDRPDLLRLDIDGYHVLENTSDGGGVRFAPRASGVLEYEHGLPYEPEATWAHDLNGDGNPDLLGRTSDRISVWYGRGNFRFDEQEHAYPFVNLDGSEVLDLAPWEINWLDANNDGLTDALLSLHSEAHLFVNEGTHFAEVRAGAFDDAWNLGWLVGAPVVGDHHGAGETEVAYSGVDGSFAFSLTRPSVGLLTRVDDGRGNVFDFAYARMEAHPGVRRRSPVLSSVTKTSGGLDPVAIEYRYANPVMHGVGKFMIGFAEVVSAAPMVTESVQFHHDDEVSRVVLGSEVTDTRSEIVRFSRHEHVDTRSRGVRWLRPDKAWAGVRKADGTGELSTLTEIVEYQRDVCATQVRTTNQHGALLSVTGLADLPALAHVDHCMARSKTTSGTHADSTRDFTYELVTDRNALGQPTFLHQRGPDGSQLLQSLTYDALHRIATTTTPGLGTATVSYDQRTGALERVTAPDGTTRSARQVDPITDLLHEMDLDRGPESLLVESFRFDGLERLVKSWDDVGSSDEASPDTTYQYEFARGDGPGWVRSSELVDAAGGRVDTLALSDSVGQVVASARRIPEGWHVSSLSRRQPAVLEERGYRRRSAMGDTTDLSTLAYDTLMLDTVEHGFTRRAGLGHVVLAESTQQAGVVRRVQTGVSISDAELVSWTLENGIYLTTTATDVEGRVLWQADASGHVTHTDRDALGRVVGLTLPDGRTHALRFDGYGRVAEVTRPDVGAISYGYDATTGLLASKEIRGRTEVVERTVEWKRDDLGRVLREEHQQPSTGASRAFAYQYDGKTDDGVVSGQRGYGTQVKGDGFRRVTIYDRDGELLESRVELTGWRTVEQHFTRFEDGSPRDVTWIVRDAGGGELYRTVQTSVVDEYGRLSGLEVDGRGLATLRYDSEDRLAHVDLAGGLTIAHHFDEVTGRLKGYWQDAIDWNGGVDMELDARGQIGAEVLSFGDRSLRRTYSYDPRGFLASASDTEQASEYTYDSGGRIATISDLAGSRPITTVLGLVMAGDRVYRFDSLGRMTGRGGLELTWGPSGEIDEARTGGKVLGYRYDEHGSRLLKTENGSPVAAYIGDAYLDGDRLVLPIKVGNRLIGLLDVSGQGTSWELVATDPRGTVIGEDGVENLSTPYGVRARRPELAAVLDFVERGYDADLGTVRFGVRDYDPHLGQFITPDPLFTEDLERCAASPVECNLYSYAANNPIRWTDPTGYGVGDFLSGVVDGVASVARGAGEVGMGVGRAGWSAVKGTAHAIRHPIETGKGIYQLARHPIRTGEAIVAAGKEMVNGCLGGNLGTCGEAAFELIPFGKIGKLGAVGKLANKLDKVADTGRALDKFDDAADAARITAKSSSGPKLLGPGKDRSVPAPAASGGQTRFVVTESGVAIPTNPAELRSNLSQLPESSTNPATSRKFVGTDSQGPIRVRVEQAHPDDPTYQGPPDPLHTVDHLHIDRRANGQTGSWGSEEKVSYDWPF